MVEEILLECVQIGKVLRVAAVDPRTLVEVIFQAPAGTPLVDLERLARQRLARAEGRRRNPSRKSQGHGTVA